MLRNQTARLCDAVRAVRHILGVSRHPVEPRRIPLVFVIIRLFEV